MSKMIQEKKQKYSSTFKAEVALEALKADKKVAEVSEQFGISSSLVYAWRKQLVTRARVKIALAGKSAIALIRVKRSLVIVAIERNRDG